MTWYWHVLQPKPFLLLPFLFQFLFISVLLLHFLQSHCGSIIFSLSSLHFLLLFSRYFHPLILFKLGGRGFILRRATGCVGGWKHKAESSWQANSNWGPGERRVCSARLHTTAVSLSELGLRSRKERKQRVLLVVSDFSSDCGFHRKFTRTSHRERSGTICEFFSGVL